jgi:hypothetical protein
MASRMAAMNGTAMIARRADGRGRESTPEI